VSTTKVAFGTATFELDANETSVGGHPARRWKRADVTTEMLCYAIHRHGVAALDILHGVLGIPPKVLVAAVHRDTTRGFVDWGVSPWRPFLGARGLNWVRAGLLERSKKMRPEASAPAESKPNGGCNMHSPRPIERQHEVEIVTTHPADSLVDVDRQKVVGGDAWVAAALRAFANQIDPPPPPAPPRPHYRG
jgi:hypothetical protein